MIEVELNEDEQSVGTFVNLQASIDAHEKTFHTEFEPLHRGTELTHHEFESITNADVNKLEGTGWKNKKKHGQKGHGSPVQSDAASKSGFGDEGDLGEVLNLKDALRRFDLDKDGRLDEKEQAALFRT